MSSAISPLAAALGKIPSGLAIATSAGAHDRTAFLASWYQQVSFNPPLIALSIKSPDVAVKTVINPAITPIRQSRSRM